MRDWPIGLRLAIWSVLVTASAVVLCYLTAIWQLRRDQLANLDRILGREAEEFFSEMKRAGAGHLATTGKLTPEMMPSLLAARFFELRGPSGLLLYRSPNLSATDLSMLAPGPDVAADGKHLRLRTYVEQKHTLYLAADTGEIESLLESMTAAFRLALPFVIVAVLAVIWLIARRTLRPIEIISHAAECIDAEQLSQRLPETSRRDELGLLTTVLNGMLDRLDARFQQAKRFTADASHELRTPLAVMRAAIQNLQHTPNLDHGIHEGLDNLLDQTRRLTAITEDLLLLSRVDSGKLELDIRSMDLVELIHEVLEDASVFADERNVQISSVLPESIPTRGDRERLRQVLLNLLSNAVKYNHDNGNIRVIASCKNAQVTVSVANTGVGIPEKSAPMIFERFFRAEHTGAARGHGLGLSIARELARAHHGEVSLTRNDSEWTEFTLTLPFEGTSTEL